jgi:hypothetical protein
LGVKSQNVGGLRLSPRVKEGCGTFREVYSLKGGDRQRRGSRKGSYDLAGKAEILLRAAVASLLSGMTQGHQPTWANIDKVNQALAGGDLSWITWLAGD